MYREIKVNLQEQEDLFEMSNLKSARTNLKADLWVEEKGETRSVGHNEPRVKVTTINHGRFPISISGRPKPLKSTEGFKKEDLDIIKNVTPFIRRNRDILLQFYKGEIDIDDLLSELSKRGDYKRNK